MPCAYFHEALERRARHGDIEARVQLLGLYEDNRLYVHVPSVLHLFLAEVLTLYYLIPAFGLVVLYLFEYYFFSTVVTIMTLLSVVYSIIITRIVRTSDLMSRLLSYSNTRGTDLGKKTVQYSTRAPNDRRTDAR